MTRFISKVFLMLLLLCFFSLISFSSTASLLDHTEFHSALTIETPSSQCVPSTEPTNNILPIFNILKKELSEFDFIDIGINRTNNCLPSLLGTLKSSSNTISNEEMIMLEKLIIHFSTKKTSSISACSAENLLGCCMEMENTHVDCLLSQNITPNSPPGIKVGAQLMTMALIAHELSRNSFILKKSEIKTYRFDGDQLFFAWPRVYKINNAEYFILTKLTANLVNNLSTTISLLTPTLRAAFNKEFPGSSSYECTKKGIFPRHKFQLTKEAILSIGTGTVADILRPNGKNYPSSISIHSGKNGNMDLSYIEIVPRIAPPIGGENKLLFEFSKEIKTNNLNPLECYGDVFLNIFNNPSLLRSFNTLDASVFIFEFLYLNGAYREFIEPATQETIQKANFSKEVRKKETVNLETNLLNYNEEIDCSSLCDDQDPKCLLIDIRDDLHYDAYNKLYRELNKPVPFEISQNKLKEIFGWDEAPDFRGAIKFKAEGVSNSGELAHTIKEIDGFKRVIINYPESISSTYKKTSNTKNGDSYLLEFLETNKSPSVNFYETYSNKIDTIFDSRWGGNVRNIAIDSRRILIKTKSCLEIPLQASDIVNYEQRMSLLSNYLKIQEIDLLMGNHEFQEIGLLTSSSCEGPRYGGRTPHIGCPVGQYKCSCDVLDTCCSGNQTCSCDKGDFPICK